MVDRLVVTKGITLVAPTTIHPPTHRFDNGVNFGHDDEQNAIQVGYSRMLAIRLDPSEETATIEWGHALGYNSSVFGDADKLPSGNIIGCGWPISGVLNDGQSGERAQPGVGGASV